METNIAYGVHSNVDAIENNTYELMEVVPEPKKSSSSFSPTKLEAKTKEVEAKAQKKEEGTMKRKDYCFDIFITIIAVTALLLVLIFLTFFLFHYISYQPLKTQQSAAIESLQSLLNSSNKQLQLQACI